jgi:large subunit ribosomal protein L24
MNKIRKGDTVVVITGKDKGRRGTVLKTDEDRVLVEGVNKVKKHVRPNPTKNQPGGILEKELSIHLSNVALVNPATQKADRVGFKVLEDGRKVRVFRSNGETVEA